MRFGAETYPPAPFPEGKGRKQRFGEIFGIMMPKISPVSSDSPPRALPGTSAQGRCRAPEGKFGEGLEVGCFRARIKMHPAIFSV